MINTKCKKCGIDDASIKYYGDTVTITMIDSMRGREIHSETTKSINEKLEITCNRCGYSWEETPLDTKAELN